MPAKRRPPVRKRPTSVVALGASAGGLESLGHLLAGLPGNFPAPILVVLHLDPHHRSQAVPLLQRHTKLLIQSARAGMHIQAGTVYVAPPDHHLELHNGKLRLTHAPRVNYSRPSVDLLFASVAADYGPAAIAAVLSGAGNDGAAGLAAVKARGGLAVAEDASTAAFTAMPEAAARTGLLDAILPIGQIPAFLVRALSHRVTVSESQWARMLALVEARSGTKFSRYRSTTLHRRLQQRLATRGCRTMAEYLRLLTTDEAELEQLQAAFLIKVSSFLRDPTSWKALERRIAVLPIRGRGVRAWSAGCATGEEPYTLALVLARQFGTGPDAHWKVFATDLDETALSVARAARYSDDRVKAIAGEDREEYFVREGTSWRVGKELRARVVFGRHDLLRDPPLSGIDILACRNVLIYFTPEEKQRTLQRLSVAVSPGGILFLGPSEAMGPVPGFDRIGYTTFFQRRVLRNSMPARKRIPSKELPVGLGGVALGAFVTKSPSIIAVAIDTKDKVLLWNRAAEAFFGEPAAQAIGRTLTRVVGKDTALQFKAAQSNKGVGETSPVECQAFDGPRRLDVECLPAAPPWAALFLGIEAQQAKKSKQPVAAVVPRQRMARSPAERTRHLTPAARLLAQQDLNEELQSRNEELETVNEELQSLNEEMSAMEEEMRGLGEASQRANNFLTLLLDTSPDVLIACDADNRVAFWSKAAIKRFRLSPAQAVGSELFDLVPALSDAALRAASKKVRQVGGGGRIIVKQDGVEHLFDPLPAGAGKGRGYLLRMRPKAP